MFLFVLIARGSFERSPSRRRTMRGLRISSSLSWQTQSLFVQSPGQIRLHAAATGLQRSFRASIRSSRASKTHRYRLAQQKIHDDARPRSFGVRRGRFREQLPRADVAARRPGEDNGDCGQCKSREGLGLLPRVAAADADGGGQGGRSLIPRVVTVSRSGRRRAVRRQAHSDAGRAGRGRRARQARVRRRGRLRGAVRRSA